jgi:uncharacterized protein (DUF4415 family)
MSTYVTLRDGRKILLNTPQEDAAINAAIASDPDTYTPTAEEWQRMKRHHEKPVAATAAARRPTLSLRVDPDVLERLRESGKGWQTRVHALLRKAVEQGLV